MDENQQPVSEPTPPATGADTPPASAAPPPAPSSEPAPAAAPPMPAAAAAPPPPAASYSWETPSDPAGPAPGVRFAGHPGRLVAYIIDGFIVGIVVTVLAIALAVPTGLFAANDNEGLAAAFAFLLVGVILVVSIGFWARSGHTPGMRVFKLRVVRDVDGGPISGGTAVIRLIGLWISGAVFYLGYIWILIDKRRRGWHDLLAGTCVIETD
jgi:uncharacterized RDD family membrane protein YckC